MNLKKLLAKNQRRIGLTGGIASGKSTISEYLHKKKKLKILDADYYSKQLIQPGKDSYQKIVDHYGEEIIEQKSLEKHIKTSELKDIIFKDYGEKIWLENLLHPLIKVQMINDCSKLEQEKIIVLVIPLLFEANFNDLCTEIWLVKCSEKTQKERLMNRDKIPSDEALKIIHSQMSNIEKEKQSDIILVNENNMMEWKDKLDKLL